MGTEKKYKGYNARDVVICVNCNEKEAEVKHHIDYETKETIDVCWSCHQRIHANKNHKFYPKNQWNKTEGRTFAFKTEPDLAEKIFSINPEGTITSNLKKALNFYFENYSKIDENVVDEVTFNELLREYFKLVNYMIEQEKSHSPVGRTY